MTKRAFKAVLLAFTALHAAPAFAQAQTERPAAPADAAQEPSVAQEQEIIVTGSRLITNGNNMPTPVTVVAPDQLVSTKPGRVFEAMQDLPVFAGSRGVSNTPSNSQPNAGTSVSTLNLRNLGGLRVLALFDGRRVPPATADGYVDINAVPQMLLQRVDIVTGGASAVYGSDAVSGVVNFVTDRTFNGVKIHAQKGISTYGDAPSYDVGIAGGTSLFGGRAHIEASYQRIWDEGIPHKGARDWATRNYTVQGNGTTVPYHLQDDVHIAFATFGGLIVCPGASGFRLPCPTSTAPGYRGPLIDYTFDQNGVLTPFEIGRTGPSAGLTDATIQLGGDGAWHTWPSLKSETQLDQAFGRFDFEVTPDIHFYAQGSYTRDYINGNPTNLRFFGQGVNIGSCNAYLAASYQSAFGCTAANSGINATNQPTFTFNKIFNFEMNPAAPGANMESIIKNYFVMTGFEGKLGPDFRWEVGYTNSKSQYRLNVNKNMNMARVNAALDAVVNPANGQIVCRVSLTQYANNYPGCVPINLFGPSAESQEAFDYIFTKVWHETTNTLNDFTASISGSPFDLWAGPVQLALSGEYRKQTYRLHSSSLPSEVQDCLGIRFNCTPGVSPLNINQFAARSQTEQKVSEVAGEINLPLLRNMAFVQDLNLNAAARYTHYSNDPNDASFDATSFNATTWKVGLTWEVADFLRLRAGRSRDIRAPNLYDLYSPVAINRSSFTFDYLLNVNLNVPIQSGGNPDLQPEVANTLTLGAVISPIKSLSFAVDYYNIKITDALAIISGTSQAVQQGCYASGGSSPLCQLLVRAGGSPTSANLPLTLVYNRAVNIAEQTAEGLDFEANFRSSLFGAPFTLRALVTHQWKLVYSQPPLPTNNQAGISYNSTYGLLPMPKTKVAVLLHIEPLDGLGIDISERWRSKLRLAPKELANGSTSLVEGDIPAVAYTNVTATWTLPSSMGNYQVFFNVQNLFDKDPPPAGTAQLNQFQPGLPPNGWAVGDDVVGRYFTAGVRVKF